LKVKVKPGLIPGQAVLATEKDMQVISYCHFHGLPVPKHVQQRVGLISNTKQGSSAAGKADKADG